MTAVELEDSADDATERNNNWPVSSTFTNFKKFYYIKLLCV